MKTFVIAFSMIVFSVFESHAQWTQLNGPENCTPTALIGFSDTILCGTPQGIYISTDEGQHWSDFTNFPVNQIQSMLNFSDTLILFYYDASLYSSSSFDGGLSWSIPQLLSSANYLNAAKYGNSIMASVENKLMVSNNYGLTWSNVPFPLGQIYAQTYFFDSVYVTYTVNGNFTTNFKYWGHGGTSNIQIMNDPLNTIAGIVAVDTILFGYRQNTASYYDIVRSTDGGQSWQPVQTVNQTTDFYLYVFDGNVYYKSSWQFYKSTDMGFTWNPSPYPHKYEYAFNIPISNGDEICAYSGFLVHYIDSTDTCYLSQSGIKGSYIRQVISANGDIYCLNGIGDFQKSTDQGLTWDTINTYLTSNVLIMGDTILINDYCFMRSYDGGQSWSTAQCGTPIYFSPIINIGNRIFSSWQDTYYSDDFGNNWTMLPSMAITTNCSWTVPGSGSLAGFNGDLYNVTNEGIVFKYDFTIQSWTDVYCWPVNAWGNYTFVPEIRKVNNMLVVTCDTAIFTSNDGQTWHHPAMHGLPFGSNGKRLSPQDIIDYNGNLIGLCGSYGIYYSYNGGNNWFPFIPVTPFIVSDLAIFNNQLLAGSYYRGLWLCNLNILEVNKYASRKNEINVYPVPASDYFNVDIPADMKGTELIITDQLGRVRMQKKLTMNQSVFSTEGLRSGIYLGKVTDNSCVLGTFKLTILK